MKRKSLIISELDDIIKESESYFPSARSVLNISVATELSTKFVSAIFRYTYVNDPYRIEVDEVFSSSKKYIPGSPQGRTNRAFELLGILKALRYDIEKGYLENLSEQIHADSYGDMLHMTNELLRAKLKDPAAVVIGTSLELHIKNLCKKHKISLENEKKKLKNANTLNSDLYKAKIITSIDHKQVLAWQAIRNDAAHGRYTNYTIEQVENMKTGIINFIEQHPA